jgi:DedD protein
VVEQVGDFPQDVLDEQAYRPVELVDEVAIDDPQGETPSTASQPDETQVVAVKPAPPVTTSREPAATEPEIDIQDSGWVVQLGSFRYEKNVRELIATLKNAGYRAYSQPVRTNVGVLNKVFVGPELEREKLEQALPHLQELTQLKGKITAFEVSAD